MAGDRAASVVQFPARRWRKTSATNGKISATPPKRQRRETLTVAENPRDLSVYVSAADLVLNIGAGAVRVHKHGSGEYRGHYLCLRPRGGRREKRPMLATGRPAKLKEYLSTLGVHLCISCRVVAEGVSCPRCGGK